MADDDLLRERARRLARPPTGRDDAPRRSLLRFSRAGDHFAVPLEAARQVMRVDAAAWLPSASWPLVAVAPLGDQVVPVLDLARTDASGAARTPPAWGVALVVGMQQVAVAADEVLDLAEVADDEITWARANDHDRSWAAGITAQGDAVIDLETVRAALAPDVLDDTTPRPASTRSDP